MKPLVCDVCGGKLIMGSSGIATCESCGLQYNQEWIREKVQEIKGVVSVDNTHMIDSWMKMARSASDAGNQKEAYDYYTRVVEIDPQNWRAIYEKGKAGAWQSTLGNIRISELYQGIATALMILNKNNASNKEMANVKNEFAVELAKVNCAIVDKKNQLFEDIKDLYFDSHLERMIENRNMFATNVKKMEEAMSLIADLDDDLSKANVIAFKKRICDDICWACRRIAYWTDYSQSKLGYFGYKEREKKQLIDKFWSYILDIRMTDSDYKRRYNMYEVGLPDPGDPDSKHANTFEYWEWKQKEIDREVQRRKRNEEYWMHHKEERIELQKREQGIKGRIKEKKSAILPFKKRIEVEQARKNDNVEGEEEYKEIKSKIAYIENEIRNTCVFSIRRKKQLQEELQSNASIAERLYRDIQSKKAKIRQEADENIKKINQEAMPLMQELTALEAEERSINETLNKNY